MKLTFIVILTFIANFLAIGQCEISIYKKWIGVKSEYLEISRKKIGVYSEIIKQEYSFRFKDSILTLIDNRYSKFRFFRNPEKFYFRVSKLTRDTLIIIPIDKYTKVWFTHPDLIFINQAIFYQKDLLFQKIYFSSSVCMGKCPAFDFELDSAGKIILQPRAFTGLKKDIYRGRLSDRQLEELKEILKFSRLDYLPEKLNFAFDAQCYDIKIFCEHKLFESHGNVIPGEFQPLFNYLLKIPSKVKFTRIAKSNAF